MQINIYISSYFILISFNIQTPYRTRSCMLRSEDYWLPLLHRLLTTIRTLLWTLCTNGLTSKIGFEKKTVKKVAFSFSGSSMKIHNVAFIVTLSREFKVNLDLGSDPTINVQTYFFFIIFIKKVIYYFNMIEKFLVIAYQW